MSLLIEDEATVAAIHRLAELTNKSAEDVVRQAVDMQIERQKRTDKRMAAIHELQERFARIPKSGLTADKAFFDDLGGGL